jgi:hypothetical protein
MPVPTIAELTWLDAAMQPQVIEVNGVAVTRRLSLNFTSGFSVTDDADNQSTDVAVAASGNTVTPGVLSVALGNGTTIATATQASYRSFKFTGSPSSPPTFEFPAFVPDGNGANGGNFSFSNTTGQPVTISVAGATQSCTIPAGLTAVMQVSNDGAFISSQTMSAP